MMIDDRDLEKGPELQLATPPPDSGPPLKPIAIVSALLILFIAGGAWWMSRRPQPVAQNDSPRAVTATEAPIEKSEESSLPPPPPLSEMDGYLRPLLAALSSRPELAAWLATDDLVRQLAMAIDQAAVGGSPARDFKVLAPEEPFTTAGPATQRAISADSYRRYDGLVTTVTSINAQEVAEIYRAIRPRLNEAYQSLGHPQGDVDRAIRNALDILIDTPIVQGPVRVVAKGGNWAYADPELEELTPTQKQILRMGPEHSEAVVNWLRALRDAL